MKYFAVVLPLLLAACSSAPEPAAKTEPKQAPTPLTGRQGIQSTFPSARAWSADAQLFRARSLNLAGYPSTEGKAIAWEVTYVSASKGASRTFQWSAVELGNVHEGVFAGPQQSWRQGRETPIDLSQLGEDTPELLAEANDAAKDYLKSSKEKPAITYHLESNPRFPVPSWQVMWGNTAGTAQYVVHLDAKSGDLLGKN